MRRLRILNYIHEQSLYPGYSKLDIFMNNLNFRFEEGPEGEFRVYGGPGDSPMIRVKMPPEKPSSDDIMVLKSRLDDYIGFDSDEIFLCNDIVRIFGGALRDCINGSQINDIDILCTAKSRIVLDQLLVSHNYKKIMNMHKNSLAHLYKGIHVISEPTTYMNSDMQIIQLIFPAAPQDYIKSFTNLITNVDISCCGISYNGINLYENVSDAILHAQYKRFVVMKSAKMYQTERIGERINKFVNRGYHEITDVAKYRSFKINLILNSPTNDRMLNINYIQEYRIN